MPRKKKDEAEVAAAVEEVVEEVAEAPVEEFRFPPITDDFQREDLNRLRDRVNELSK